MGLPETRLERGHLGAARQPGPLGLGSASMELASWQGAEGALRASNASTSAQEQLRLRLLEIRRTMRDLLKNVKLPENGVILYSRTAPALPAFSRFLVDNRFAKETVYLEQTDAGKYLEQQTTHFLKSQLAPGDKDDWNRWKTFDDGSGTTFTASLMGFWRELSARFAKLAVGDVHVLVPPELLDVPAAAQSFWSERLKDGHIKGLQAKDFLGDLRTFGFVEFPVLFGLISKSASVRSIRMYKWSGGNSFAFVRAIHK